jgi:hypothetical protein
MRQAVAPLAAAARWERRHLPDQTPPITKIDVESAFLLTVPLSELPADQSGTCRLAVESQGGDGKWHLAGVTVDVDAGRIVSCIARVDGVTGTSALGTAGAWGRAVIDGETHHLDVTGESDLAESLLKGLHTTFLKNLSWGVTAEARH